MALASRVSTLRECGGCNAWSVPVSLQPHGGGGGSHCMGHQRAVWCAGGAGFHFLELSVEVKVNAQTLGIVVFLLCGKGSLLTKQSHYDATCLCNNLTSTLLVLP